MTDAAEKPRWGCPRAWQAHLLITVPGRASVREKPREDRHGRPLRLDQLHSMRRDEQGRFNELLGGKPDHTHDAYEAMQQWSDEMFEAGHVRNLTPPRRDPCASIDPYAIEAAIQALKQDGRQYKHLGRLYEVLRYFQSPPALRQFEVDGFACQLDPPTDKAGLYRLKKWACYAVWERLPIAERLKAGE